MPLDAPLPSTADVHARGVEERRATARRDLATLTVATRDPLGILAAQNETRIPDLIGLRAERMSTDPFAFYRGTAALMAADLADDPHSGIVVASCGDAHVANFGFYASPQRTLVFDLNDFDEAAWAPWEWDVKRLVTSIVVGGRHTSRDAAVTERAARAAVGAYLATLRRLTALSARERYSLHLDPKKGMGALAKTSRKALAAAMSDALRRTGDRAARRWTTTDAAGRAVFVEAPPTMTHVDDEIEERARSLYGAYQRSASVDIALLLQHYAVADVARRVVGVGSVGTRCYLAALEDGDGRVMLLQMKQAGPSVLEQYGRIEQPFTLRASIADGGQGARVVSLQRIQQAFSDPFLGYVQTPAGDYYVRQFHDLKGSIDTDSLEDVSFVEYAQACGGVLARAHAQDPVAAEIVGYAGNGRQVTDAILEWSLAYANLSAADFRDFVSANAAPSDPVAA